MMVETPREYIPKSAEKKRRTIEAKEFGNRILDEIFGSVREMLGEIER